MNRAECGTAGAQHAIGQGDTGTLRNGFREIALSGGPLELRQAIGCGGALENINVAIDGAPGSGPWAALGVVSAAGDEEDIAVRSGEDTGKPGIFLLAMTGGKFGDFFPLDAWRNMDGVAFRDMNGSGGNGGHKTSVW